MKRNNLSINLSIYLSIYRNYISNIILRAKASEFNSSLQCDKFQV
jgi:hypothetical protein